jgi:phosphopantetheinyl transferase (holo-ACP synthase)
MIGNDIIDLLLAEDESNWQRKGFVEKIFTQSEQDLIFTHEIPESMVWILWSMKESAYKIYNRLTGQRAYVPLFFECSEPKIKSNHLLGKVVTEELLFYTKTYVTKDSIETIAVLERQDLKKVVRVDKNVVLKNSNGIPNLLDMKASEYRPVSVSHHGRFESIVTI